MLDETYYIVGSNLYKTDGNVVWFMSTKEWVITLIQPSTLYGFEITEEDATEFLLRAV